MTDMVIDYCVSMYHRFVEFLRVPQSNLSLAPDPPPIPPLPPPIIGPFICWATIEHDKVMIYAQTHGHPIVRRTVRNGVRIRGIRVFSKPELDNLRLTEEPILVVVETTAKIFKIRFPKTTGVPPCFHEHNTSEEILPAFRI